MPKAVKKTKITTKKPSQQDGDERVGDGNDASVMDAETREDGTDGRTAVLTDGDTQEAGVSGLQGHTAGSGEDSSGTDSLVERARQRLAQLK